MAQINSVPAMRNEKHSIYNGLHSLRESIFTLKARQTEIVNCNWEGNASRAPPKVGRIFG